MLNCCWCLHSILSAITRELNIFKHMLIWPIYLVVLCGTRAKICPHLSVVLCMCIFSISRRYPCNRPWRPIGLWDVSHFLDNRLTNGGKALRAGSPLPPGRFLVFISVRVSVDPRAIMLLEGLGKLIRSNDLIGNRTRDLPACSICLNQLRCRVPPHHSMDGENHVLNSYCPNDTSFLVLYVTLCWCVCVSLLVLAIFGFWAVE
jgi:hypothetical protein